MDPVVTLTHLRACIDSRDYGAAVEALNSYYQWRLKGGFGDAQLDLTADRLATRLADRLDL